MWSFGSLWHDDVIQVFYSSYTIYTTHNVHDIRKMDTMTCNHWLTHCENTEIGIVLHLYCNTYRANEIFDVWHQNIKTCKIKFTLSWRRISKSDISVIIHIDTCLCYNISVKYKMLVQFALHDIRHALLIQVSLLAYDITWLCVHEAVFYSLWYKLFISCDSKHSCTPGINQKFIKVYSETWYHIFHPKPILLTRIS